MMARIIILSHNLVTLLRNVKIVKCRILVTQSSPWCKTTPMISGRTSESEEDIE